MKFINWKDDYEVAERGFQLKYLTDMVRKVNPEVRVDIHEPHSDLLTVYVYYKGEKENGISIQEYNNAKGLKDAIAAIERTFTTYADFYKKKTNATALIR